MRLRGTVDRPGPGLPSIAASSSSAAYLPTKPAVTAQYLKGRPV